MDIISTLGQSLDYNNSCLLIEKLIEEGCKTFRYNLSKYDSYASTYKRIAEINRLQQTFGKDFNVLIDLPFPNKKPRLYIGDKILNVRNGQYYYISSDYITSTSNDKIGVDIKAIGNRIVEDSRFIYDDGKGYFAVDSILDSETVRVKAMGDFCIHDRKSIFVNHILVNTEADWDYIKMVRDINPNSIALSFVERAEDIDVYKGFFSGIELISKIETEKAVKNIDQIAKKSNVMIARGDLLLYSDPFELFVTQRKIFEAAKKNQKHLYIATGILNSLTENIIPSQSDLIDLYTILSMAPKGIILNFPLVIQKHTEAFDTITKMLNLRIKLWN